MLFNLQAYGKSAVRRLADLGVLTPATVAEHFVWVTDEDLAIFADSGAVASTNAGSNLRLATGICRVRDIMDSGGRVGFGTDGISFSDREDFFAELRLAATCSGCRATFGTGRLDSEQVLRAAGQRRPGGGPAEPGWAAWSPAGTPTCWCCPKTGSSSRPAATTPSRSWTCCWTAPRQPTSTRSWCTGRILMEDGRVTIVDEDQVRGGFAEAVARAGLPALRQVRRWAELGTLVEPYLPDLYRPWYETPIEPAYVVQPPAPAASPGAPPPPAPPCPAAAAGAPAQRCAASAGRGRAAIAGRSADAEHRGEVVAHDAVQLVLGIGGRLTAAASSLTVCSLSRPA